MLDIYLVVQYVSSHRLLQDKEADCTVLLLKWALERMRGHQKYEADCV